MNELRRIDQTAFGVNGNCQSACLAMLLGLRLEEVPNFLEVPGADRDDAVSFNAQRDWLNERGWQLITLPAKGHVFRHFFHRGYILAGGMSPRGHPHAVIYKDGELWHDPHPSRAGLVEIDDVDVLYPLDPSRVAQLELELRSARSQRDDFKRQLGAEREARMALERIVDEVRARNRELERLINSPEIENFLEGVRLEAAHQIERWGEAHDREKSAENWFWLVGYLAGKALRAAITGDRAKALHHCVSSAAALLNWHKAIQRDTTGAGVGQDTDLQVLDG